MSKDIDAPQIQEPPNAPTREELTAFIRSFPFWYQRIYLGHGVYSIDNEGHPAYHELVWKRLKIAFPQDLQGVSVLDVGCNAGYFAIETKRAGAGKVVGVEFWKDFVTQAEACRKIWDLDIEYRLMDAHQLAAINEEFDIAVFTGILYHLKNPLEVIEAVGNLCRDAILVETEIIPEDRRNTIYLRQGELGKTSIRATHTGFIKFIEGSELNGDPSNWWVPDTECVKAMLRTAGFRYFSKPLYQMESRLIMIASKKSNSILDLGALK